TARDDELRRGQRYLEAMIDWLVQLYLAHTPEVPEERRPAAAAAVQRRYRNYRKAVAGSVEDAETHGGGAEPSLGLTVKGLRPLRGSLREPLTASSLRLRSM